MERRGIVRAVEMGLPRGRQKMFKMGGRGGAVVICRELPKHARDEGREEAATSLQKLPKNWQKWEEEEGLSRYVVSYQKMAEMRGRGGVVASCR